MMSKATNCTAAFSQSTTYDLTVKVNGAGSVTSTPTGINCGSSCVSPFHIGSMVKLTAVPTPKNTFAGWSGDCVASNADPKVTNITMAKAKSYSATFDVIPSTPVQNLSINLIGVKSTSGRITSLPNGIDCGTICNSDFIENSTVTLNAIATDATSVFASWDGDSVGTRATTVVQITNTAKSCTARFDAVAVKTYVLSVSKIGTLGKGMVTSRPVGDIDCGATCQKTYKANSKVTLIATPADNTIRFAGWSGGGSGMGDAVITMKADTNCIAKFDVIPVSSFDLTAIISGTGTGTVTADSTFN